MSLYNAEKKGYKNLYFSRAGQYDRAHNGTYGDDKMLSYLSELENAGLGFKPQISAGYANIGHSDGKGGEHTRPGVFDIGLSNLNPSQKVAIRKWFDSHGYDYLYEDPNGKNEHIHVRGKKNSKNTQPNAYGAKPTMATQQNPYLASPPLPQLRMSNNLSGLQMPYPAQAPQSALANYGQQLMAEPVPQFDYNAEVNRQVQENQQRYMQAVNQAYPQQRPSISRSLLGAGIGLLGGALLGGGSGALIGGLGGGLGAFQGNQERLRQLSNARNSALLQYMDNQPQLQKNYQEQLRPKLLGSAISRLYGGDAGEVPTELAQQVIQDRGSGNINEQLPNFLNLKAALQERTRLNALGQTDAANKVQFPELTVPENQVNATAYNTMLQQILNPSNDQNAIDLAQAPYGIQRTISDANQGIASAANSQAQAITEPQRANTDMTRANADMTRARASMINATAPPEPTDMQRIYRTWKAENPNGTVTDFLQVYKPGFFPTPMTGDTGGGDVLGLGGSEPRLGKPLGLKRQGESTTTKPKVDTGVAQRVDQKKVDKALKALGL